MVTKIADIEDLDEQQKQILTICSTAKSSHYIAFKLKKKSDDNLVRHVLPVLEAGGFLRRVRTTKRTVWELNTEEYKP